jgi:hypothetical protein
MNEKLTCEELELALCSFAREILWLKRLIVKKAKIEELEKDLDFHLFSAKEVLRVDSDFRNFAIRAIAQCERKKILEAQEEGET